MKNDEQKINKLCTYFIACSSRLDSGEQVKSYAASAKRNTRGDYFFPRQFIASSPPSERLEQVTYFTFRASTLKNMDRICYSKFGNDETR